MFVGIELAAELESLRERDAPARRGAHYATVSPRSPVVWTGTCVPVNCNPVCEPTALGYKQLQRVEQAWRRLESGLRMRPVLQ